MKVLIPPPLHSYTQGRSEMEAAGATVGELLEDLDRRHPGLRFRIVDEQDRIRPHIKLFVNTELAADLSRPTGPDDRLQIVCALSGG